MLKCKVSAIETIVGMQLNPADFLGEKMGEEELYCGDGFSAFTQRLPPFW